MIECYVMCWNEEETIHLTIKHYQKFCSRINILDNYSTDRTQEIAKDLGCKIITFGQKGVLSDSEYIKIKNNVWKKDNDKRDYVIIVDADEILDLPDWLEAGPKYPTIFHTYGWNVFSHDVPRENWLDITNGYHEPNYSKTALFDPKAIEEINFRVGSHVSSPKGRIVWGDTTLTLFHYRNVGGPQRLIDRHNLYRPRMSQENIQKNWGHHYLQSDEERIKEWESKYQKSNPFFTGWFLMISFSDNQEAKRKRHICSTCEARKGLRCGICGCPLKALSLAGDNSLCDLKKW